MRLIHSGLVRFVAALMLAAGFALLVSCSDDGDSVAQDLVDFERGPDVPIVIPSGAPIVIGVSSALTGPIRERGEEYRDAVISGVEAWKAANGREIAGHPIELRAEDDGCTAAGAAAVAAGRFTRTQGLVGVIGPQCSGGSLAAIPILTEAGIVAISGSATRTDLTTGQGLDGFFFRTVFRNDLEGIFAGQFLLSLEADRLYFVDSGEPFSVDLVDAAEDAVREAGGTILRGSVNIGEVDFGALVADVVAADPDFVGFAGFNPEAALFYRQLRDAGYQGLFGAGDAAVSHTDFVDPVGAIAEGVLFSGCQFPLTQTFLDDFVSLHGHAPEASFPAQYADAVRVLLDAVRDVAEEQPDGSLVIRPTVLRDAVRATDLRDGLSGSIAFDANGDRVPAPGQHLDEVVAAGLQTPDTDVFTTLGLISCQVQDGELVPLAGPSAREVRLP